MVNRMLEVKNHLKVVLEEQGWDDLAASEWKLLQSIVNLLQPFCKIIVTSKWRRIHYSFLCCSGNCGPKYSHRRGMYA